MIQKPIIKNSDIWANAVQTDDILVPYEKVDQGWGYANKPSYQYLNWFWNTQSAFYVHVNQNGIPEWDYDTVYASSGFVKYDDKIFQAFSSNQNDLPGINSRIWTSFEFLNGMQDVEVDMPGYKNLIIYQNKFWSNKAASEIIDMELKDLANVDTNDNIETILAVNNTNDTASDTWTNQSINDIVIGTGGVLELNDFHDTIINSPASDEILQFLPYEIEVDGEIQEQYKWQNSYYVGYCNYNNISNKPTEFNPKAAKQDTVGGARIWVDDTSGTDPILNIKTFRKGAVLNPTNLKSSNDLSYINLTWQAVSNVDSYNIYKDGVLLASVSSGDTEYNDNDSGNNWHVYYVKAVKDIGGTDYESYPSNYVLGRVR